MGTFHLDASTLFASMLWGSIGTCYFMYGWKQKSAPALWGGVALMGVTYFIASPLWMTVACVALMAGIYYWAKRSD
jgi:hypothetical protein